MCGGWRVNPSWAFVPRPRSIPHLSVPIRYDSCSSQHQAMKGQEAMRYVVTAAVVGAVALAGCGGTSPKPASQSNQPSVAHARAAQAWVSTMLSDLAAGSNEAKLVQQFAAADDLSSTCTHIDLLQADWRKAQNDFRQGRQYRDVDPQTYDSAAAQMRTVDGTISNVSELAAQAGCPSF